MSSKKISYLNRTFDEYRESFIELLKRYYPNISEELNDASIASWLIDLISAASDNLSYHIDRVFNETNINSAQEKSSLYSIARSNGFKIPGPKASMTEVEFSCVVPKTPNNNPNTSNFINEDILPIIKAGTKVSSGNNVFEVVEDINFKEQFNNYGVSDRRVENMYDMNGNSNQQRITKKAVVVAGETKIYKQSILNMHSKPFLEVLIPDTNVINIESVIFKDGNSFNTIPSNNEFFINDESCQLINGGQTINITRFFEVNSLLEQHRWGDSTISSDIVEDIVNENGDKVYSIVKGEWKPLKNKFITEYTDDGYMKIIFGGGIQEDNVVYSESSKFSEKQIKRMVNNHSLGNIPPIGTTMFVKYRKGGGYETNVPANTINSIIYLDAICSNSIKGTITVTNTVPSVSGKDMPTVDELRYMIKYHNASQERCVTLKDYEDRLMKMPSRYGSVFRVSATEENNKVMLYILGVDADGKLTSEIPDILKYNILNYLSMYKSLNDYVEIKSAKIINLSFEIELYVDKNYERAGVAKSVIEVVRDYFDINKRYLGEDIFVGNMQKEISMVDGVLNLIGLKIYNEVGDGYSQKVITQELVDNYDDKLQVDLVSSDYVLFSDSDCMFEIKNPDIDICLKIKEK